MPKPPAHRPTRTGWLVLVALLGGAAFLVWLRPILVLAIAAIWLVGGTLAARVERRRLRSMAAERTDQSICTFRRAFDIRTVEPRAIRAVYEELQRHLESDAPSFPLAPTDDLFRDLRIDAGDLDDIVADIAYRTGRNLKDGSRNPYYGKVTTVRDLVLFVSHLPAKHAV
jgi:hypothetical protein